MTTQKHLLFFGASVTEQNFHHGTGEMTGFVSYFEANMAKAKGLRVSRVSAGSSDLTDAALVAVEEVIAAAPDICVIDWLTPALSECDPRFVLQIYMRLLEAGIRPITVLFLRTDRIQAETQIGQEMIRICDRLKLPLFDAVELLEDHEIHEILRDTVHTSTEGARLYAEWIDGILDQIEETLPPKPDEPAPFTVVEVPFSDDVLACRTLTVRNLDPADTEPMDFCLVMQQRVGPYSPVLDVLSREGSEMREIGKFSIWDPWCYRERQCTKRLMNWHSGPMQELQFSVSETAPRYAQSPQETSAPFTERHLKPRGKLYLVATRPVHVSVEVSGKNHPSPKLNQATAPARGTQPLPTTLHIGMGKAGSSTIQGVLKSARDELLKQGFLYPQDLLPDGSRGGDNHKCLAVSCMRGSSNVVFRQHRILTQEQRRSFNRRVVALYREQVADAPNAKRCIISAEHFWSTLREDRELEWLIGKMETIGLKVDRLVFYIRRQSDWLESIQHQRIRERRELLPRTAKALMKEPMISSLNYDRVIEMWTRAFPDARFELRVFDRAEFPDGDLMVDFAQSAGIDVNLPSAIDRNVSGLSNAGVNAMIYLNKKRSDGSQHLVGISQHELEAFVARHMPGHCAILPFEECKAVDAAFAEVNERVRARYLPERNMLFPPLQEKPDREAFYQITAPGFFAAIDQLLEIWEAG